jgi:LysM repeat protein
MRPLRHGAMVWLIVALGTAAGAADPARAQSHDTLVHRVVAGDTIELLAAEYYGDRHHGIFIMVTNKLQHARPLRPGERLKIPANREVSAAVGETLETLAEQYLGDKRRAKFLAGFNQLPADASLAVGQVIQIPFHVVHKAAGKESLSAIAAAYFGSPKKTKLIQEYNFTEKKVLKAGETVVIPIHHVQVRRGRLPPPDAESQARLTKRREMQTQALNLLPGAHTAWHAGDYAAVKRKLTMLETDYLDVEVAVEVGVLLGSTYVAFGDKDSALAAFRKVLERSPAHTLDTYQYSPKIRKVWEQAGGEVRDGKRP